LVFVDGGFPIREVPPRLVRLAEVCRRLAERLPASSSEEALEILILTMNEVEDEWSGTPYDPENWSTDGRLYPPVPAGMRPVPGKPEVTRWRSKAHNTYVRANGALEIVSVRDEATIFSALGKNGKGVWDD
jgi:hypothetical protein